LVYTTSTEKCKEKHLATDAFFVPIFREEVMCVADIKVTPPDEKGRREVLVNGISIPDVISASLFIREGHQDEIALTIHADSFQSTEIER
jgi:hypothetical protein